MLTYADVCLCMRAESVKGVAKLERAFKREREREMDLAHIKDTFAPPPGARLLLPLIDP